MVVVVVKKAREPTISWKDEQGRVHISTLSYYQKVVKKGGKTTVYKKRPEKGEKVVGEAMIGGKTYQKVEQEERPVAVDWIKTASGRKIDFKSGKSEYMPLIWKKTDKGWELASGYTVIRGVEEKPTEPTKLAAAGIYAAYGDKWTVYYQQKPKAQPSRPPAAPQISKQDMMRKYAEAQQHFGKLAMAQARAPYSMRDRGYAIQGIRLEGRQEIGKIQEKYGVLGLAGVAFSTSVLSTYDPLSIRTIYRATKGIITGEPLWKIREEVLDVKAIAWEEAQRKVMPGIEDKDIIELGKGLIRTTGGQVFIGVAGSGVLGAGTGILSAAAPTAGKFAQAAIVGAGVGLAAGAVAKPLKEGDIESAVVTAGTIAATAPLYAASYKSAHAGAFRWARGKWVQMFKPATLTTVEERIMTDRAIIERGRWASRYRVSAEQMVEAQGRYEAITPTKDITLRSGTVIGKDVTISAWAGAAKAGRTTTPVGGYTISGSKMVKPDFYRVASHSIYKAGDTFGASSRIGWSLVRDSIAVHFGAGRAISTAGPYRTMDIGITRDLTVPRSSAPGIRVFPSGKPSAPFKLGRSWLEPLASKLGVRIVGTKPSPPPSMPTSTGGGQILMAEPTAQTSATAIQIPLEAMFAPKAQPAQVILMPYEAQEYAAAEPITREIGKTGSGAAALQREVSIGRGQVAILIPQEKVEVIPREDILKKTREDTLVVEKTEPLTIVRPRTRTITITRPKLETIQQQRLKQVEISQARQMQIQDLLQDQIQKLKQEQVQLTGQIQIMEQIPLELQIAETVPMMPTTFGRPFTIPPIFGGLRRIRVGLPRFRRKAVAIKTVLPDPISKMITELRFGKATAPAPTPKIWKIAERSLYMFVPTAEMLGRRRPRRKKANRKRSSPRPRRSKSYNRRRR